VLEDGEFIRVPQELMDGDPAGSTMAPNAERARNEWIERLKRFWKGPYVGGTIDARPEPEKPPHNRSLAFYAERNKARAAAAPEPTASDVAYEGRNASMKNAWRTPVQHTPSQPMPNDTPYSCRKL
jgi:hypothetical protein